MRRAKHLAIFIYGLSGGGAQRRTLTLAHAFAARGHRVDLVVVRSEGPLLREVSPRVRLVALDPRPSRLPGWLNRRSLQVAANIGALAAYLRRERPDILLSAASHVNLAALWARRLSRVPVPLIVRASNHLSRSTFTTERPPRLLRWWLARACYPWADAVIAVSDGVAEDIARLTKMPRERITTIYNPTVTEEMKAKARAPLDHPWFAPGAPPVILGAGRFVAQKDFPTLLRAFSRVRAVRPARLVILGEGRKRRRLESMARKLGVAGDVALPGYVDNALAWMARASVFVLSSAWEGLPGVLIEAMSCGCPVVSTDCPSGPSEILDRGSFGPLVPVGDDAALARAILSVLSAPPDPSRLRARAGEFSVDRAADRYLDVLLGVIGERGAPGGGSGASRAAEEAGSHGRG